MAAYIYVRNASRAGLVRRLARALGIRVVDATTAPRPNQQVSLICWGNSTQPDWGTRFVPTWLGNTPNHVSLASHKTNTLRSLTRADVPTLEYTTNRQTAIEWLRNGTSVYARTVLQGHSAEGLVYIDHRDGTDQEIPHAPLYTKDFGTPFKEYRVHVAFGRVIDVTQKRRLSQQELLARDAQVPGDRERLQVRTYGNGWIFARQDINDHQDIHDVAIRAAQALDGMPMAAVDIVAKWSNGRPTNIAVMEINSAPALRSDTLLDAYVSALRPHINRTSPVPITSVTNAPAEQPRATPTPPTPEVPAPRARVEPAPMLSIEDVREIVRSQLPAPAAPVAPILSAQEVQQVRSMLALFR